MTTHETPTVEPFSTLLSFFVSTSQWRVVTCLTRRHGDMHPSLVVRCGDRLRADFFLERGMMVFKVIYAFENATAIGRHGRIGSAVSQADDGAALCRLDPDWYDTVCEAVAKILSDLTGHRDGLQATLTSLMSDR